MSHYLFLWNPEKDEYSFHNYAEVLSNAATGKPYVTRWICPSKRPQPGDVAYMQRTGPKDNGLFARGVVKQGAHIGDDGMQVVKLILEEFLPIGSEIPRKTIVSQSKYKGTWSPMASGNVVPDEILEAIESLWPEVVATSVRASRPLQKMSTAEAVALEFESGVRTALMSSAEQRQARLAHASVRPKTVQVTTTVFVRNPDVAAEVLSRANGRCEACAQPAPFIRASDGTPYLEVHHRVRLCDGGDDIVSNALAVCPNCHRKFHFGAEVAQPSLPGDVPAFAASSLRPGRA